MPSPLNESERLKTLRSYQILDTIEEADYDELVQLAATICEVPIALISLVDGQRQWFKSHLGLAAKETPIAQSFCAHAIAQSAEIMIVPDAGEDHRFAENPLVTGDPNIVFYAGVPLVNQEGFALGTLCVIDDKLHNLTEEQKKALKILARQVMGKLELRKAYSLLHQNKNELNVVNEELASANEEYQATNEELMTSNEQLSRVSQKLETANALLGTSNKALNTANIRLSSSEKKALALLADAPVAIGLLDGRDLIVEQANSMLLEIWGKDPSIIGKQLHIALPELDGQPFLQILDEVFTTGAAFYGNNMRVFLERKGVLTEGFYNFVYHPIKNPDGVTVSIMVVANEVTEQVKAQQVVEESEKKFRNLIEQAAVAVIVFRGDDLVIDAVNPRMLNLLGKNAGINGKPLLEAVPELIGQPPYELLYQVYTTGETYTGYETPVKLIRNGSEETGYFNFTYTPLIEGGKVTGIIDMAVEVTDQVKANLQVQSLNDELTATNDNLNALNEEMAATNEELFAVNQELNRSSKKIERAETTLRFAVEAANLGTWYINAETLEFLPSPRLIEIFGYDPHEKMPYEAAVNQIAESHRAMVVKAVNAAIDNGESYDLEYPVIGFNDGIVRWVRATGKLFPAEGIEPAHFSGTVLDITRRKEQEQLKNDFISMVSHELKTPLTSLNGYLQMLNLKAKKSEDSFAVNTLDRAANQVGKMTRMINGFLNVSRLEAGKIYIDPQPFDLAVLVKESEAESLATITSHIIIYAPVEETMVYADIDKIGQVINNLISNAVKYSPPGTTIRVACETIAGQARVCVQDEGMGVKPNDKAKLFERFYRVESMEMKSIGGFGIGLYLCAEIIKRHDGKIWVESEVGKGSTFFFTLPITQNKSSGKL